MDIVQLQYFRAVAEAGNFTRAAESLHMTQSALSKSIAKLEDEIGLRLFEREGNRITLNRFGKRFLEDSDRALCQLADGVRAVREMAGLEQGEVRIAISKAIFVDHLIQAFLLQHPKVSFHCYLLSKEQMRVGLENGSIDLAISTERPDGHHIGWQELYMDRLEVLVGPTHPLAKEKVLHLEQLRDERFVHTNLNYNMENEIQNLCSHAGFEPKILYAGISNDMPMKFIEHGDAIMITPHSISAGVSRTVEEGSPITIIPLADEYPEIHKYVGVAFKIGHYQSKAAHEFYNLMLDFYSHIDD